MARKPKLFLDTSALFAGLWSESGGGRQLLRLGELGLIELVVSPQVLKEIEAALREKALQALGSLALLLDHAHIQIAESAPRGKIAQVKPLVAHPGDVHVIADAWFAETGFLVTLDRQHFLENKAFRKALPFPVGTPGDALAWVKDSLLPQE